MKAKVLGIRRNIDFTTQDNKHIVGNKLFVSYKEEGIEGECCNGIFISSDINVNHVKIGCDYEFCYDFTFGKKPKLTAIKPVLNV